MPSLKIELPPPEWWRSDAVRWEQARAAVCRDQRRPIMASDVQDAFVAYALLAVQQERERCAKLAWPDAPDVKVWTAEATETLRLAEQRAEQRGKGHYETLFAVAAAASKMCADAIRSGQ